MSRRLPAFYLFLEAPAKACIDAPIGLDVAAECLFKCAIEARFITELHRAAELEAEPCVFSSLMRRLPRIRPVRVIRREIACKFMINRRFEEPCAALRLLSKAKANAPNEAVHRALAYIHLLSGIVRIARVVDTV